MDTRPTLPNGESNYCLKCGRCCWDWKGSKDPSTKCEHLADDMKTCLIYDQIPEHEHYKCCALFPTDRRIICDLSEECGFHKQWSKE